MKNVLKGVLLVALLASAGCYHEGPLERAGREVDDTVRDATKTEKTPQEKVGESIKDLGDNIEDHS